MITEQIGYTMEVLEDGQIQVKRVTHVLRDGMEIAKTLHRHVLAPGDGIKAQDPRVAAVAAAVWTEEVVDIFAAKKAEREALLVNK